MKLVLASVFSILVLNSCGTTKFKNYQAIDLNDKSVSLPIGSHGVLGDLKDGFIQNGYRVVTYTGGVRTKDVSNSERVTEDQHQARYKILLKTSNVELFCVGEEELQFGIYVLDTKTGSEVLNMNGKECGDVIAPKFFKHLGLPYKPISSN